MPKKLRLGLSRVLRSKKSRATVPRPTQEPQRSQSILENQEFEDNQQLQQALIESLHGALEQEKGAAAAKLSDKDEQIKQMQQTVTQLSIIGDKRAQQAVLISQNLEALKGQLKEYQVSLARTVEKQVQTEKELEDATALILAAVSGDLTRPDLRHLHNQSWATVLARERAKAKEHIKSLEENIESATAFADKLKQQLEDQGQWYQEMLKKIKASNPLNVSTARQLIAYKDLSHQFAAMETVDPALNERAKQITSISQLTTDLLGAQLSEEQVKSFLREANDPSFDLTTQMCRICALPKIYAPRNPSLSEFSRVLPVEHTGRRWLRCPAPDCPEPVLNINNRVEFRQLLELLGDRNVEDHLARYDSTCTLRYRVGEMWCDPFPEFQDFHLAARLHDQLRDSGAMVSLQDALENQVTPSLLSKPGNLRMIDIEHDGRSVRLPLLTRLFRRQSTPRECGYCTEEFFEINFGSPMRWVHATRGFQGDWIWQVMNFPLKLEETCGHPIDFCTACFDRHVKAKLEEDGRAGCDKIACPHPDCGRLLTYEEIRLYAQKTTFTTYDQYLNLNALSQCPNFRWCLKPDCNNGQLYDLEDDQDLPLGGPLIRCGACDFEMCYTHSVPWHKGQTCAQYTSEHIDPNSQLSRDWIDANTKNCPKCNVSINKGDQCFHMTCACGHGFCWLCLADWELIRPNPETYNQDAHKEGCYFRTTQVRPTQLTGTTLNEALRAARRRNRS
ncbi:hypothetical protein V8F20_011928 [Naviculisporaceae sp. PSN 640]